MKTFLHTLLFVMGVIGISLYISSVSFVALPLRTGAAQASSSNPCPEAVTHPRPANDAVKHTVVFRP